MRTNLSATLLILTDAIKSCKHFILLKIGIGYKKTRLTLLKSVPVLTFFILLFLFAALQPLMIQQIDQMKLSLSYFDHIYGHLQPVP